MYQKHYAKESLDNLTSFTIGQVQVINKPRSTGKSSRKFGNRVIDFPFAAAGSTVIPIAVPRSFMREFLTGEESPLAMLGWLALLIISLHCWALFWLSRPVPSLVQAAPLPIEVTLVPAASQAPEPQAAPEPVSPPPQKAQPKPKPKPKLKPKPALKKPQPRKKEAQQAPPEPTPVAETSEAASSEKTAAVSKPVAKPSARSGNPQAERFVEANYHANYGINPKPEYPRLARARHYEGKVLLRVQVSASGASMNVRVQRSSGYGMLDDSAVNAVSRWKFIPAKRGETPVASTVVVPIIFTLEN